VTGGNPRHSCQGGSQKGIVAWKEWPPESWLETAEAKDRIAGFLRAARPLAGWLDTNVGPSSMERPAR